MKKFYTLLALVFCLNNKAQIITTLAGNGNNNYAGDGGAATNASLSGVFGIAIVIHSLAQKLIANFYMKVVKPYTPTRFFTAKEDAEKWLAEVDVEKEVSV